MVYFYQNRLIIKVQVFLWTSRKHTFSFTQFYHNEFTTLCLNWWSFHLMEFGKTIGISIILPIMMFTYDGNFQILAKPVEQLEQKGVPNTISFSNQPDIGNFSSWSTSMITTKIWPRFYFSIFYIGRLLSIIRQKSILFPVAKSWFEQKKVIFVTPYWSTSKSPMNWNYTGIKL